MFFRSQILEAIGIISGLIIGAGMFALPYSVNVSGAGWSILSMIIAFLAVLMIHLSYGEVVSNNESRHRLPGYAKIYLGNFLGNISRLSGIFGFNAGILVYAILGGIFLSHIFGGSAVFWSVVFLAAGAVIILKSTAKKIGAFNIILVIPLVLALFYIGFLSIQSGSLKNISFSSEDPFFSFGVFVFALAGMSAVADAKEVFFGKSKIETASGLRKSIVIGTILPLFLYILFVMGAIMASGSVTTEDALSGLSGILGNKILVLGAIVGVLAVFTSYLSVSYDLKEIYELDLGVSAKASWALAGILPMLLFFVLSGNFLKLVSIMGGFLIALDGIFVVFILRKMRSIGASTIQFLSFKKWHQIALVAIFILSIIYELIYQVF